MKHNIRLLTLIFCLITAFSVVLSGCRPKETTQKVTKNSEAAPTTMEVSEEKETSSEATTEATTEATSEATSEATALSEETTKKTKKSKESKETTAAPETTPTEAAIDEDGEYTTKEDVALYIYTYGHLPSNFVTKNEARDKGWEGGSLEKFFPGCSIGGDKFGNREGILPTKKGRQYYECDIDTKGAKSRGAKRIVFSNDGLIYYTEDHYETFTLLYGEENL